MSYEQANSRLRKVLRIARYWKGQSMRELMRHGAVRWCTEHHYSMSFDPFPKPIPRTQQRENALRKKGAA